MPVVKAYLNALQSALASMGYEDDLLVMQSNAGVTTAEFARQQPVHIVESGPAAGVLACCYLAKQTGEDNLIAFDMGGTTAKASLVENGKPFETAEYHVGGAMNSATSGGGQVIRVPSIEIAEVGAGGGSIAWVDPGGALRIGPSSAGAEPGPACYDRGGTDPTVTDAYAVLGYINPTGIAGGKKSISVDRAREVIKQKISQPCGWSVEDAAYGMYSIANSNMIRAVNAVTTERGRDARAYTLVAFGGAGPLHAIELAREMGVSRVLFPICPGLFSALGLLMADVEHNYSRSTLQRIEKLESRDVDRLERLFTEIEQEARSDLAAQGFDGDRIIIERSVSMLYVGQSYELSMPAPPGPLRLAALRELGLQFCNEHKRAYGYSEELSRVQVSSLRLKAIGISPKPAYGDISRHVAMTDTMKGAERHRNAYFGPTWGWQDVPIVQRSDLSKGLIGPAIVEEFDTTIVVPPGTSVSLDSYGNIIALLKPLNAAAPLEKNAVTADPMSLEVVKNGLNSIADQMSVTLARTARSLGIKDARDFSVALCNPQGELIIGGIGLAVHLGAIPPAMAATLIEFRGQISPGDVIFMNDPYSGGMHLPDIFVFKPVFYDDTLLGFAAVVAHMADIGGRVPGGNAADSTDIYQEGLRIPPMKLFRKGELDRSWLRLIGANVRQHETVLSDIFAEVAACTIAETELHKMAQRFGVKSLQIHMKELLDYGERMARAALPGLRKGRYSFVDHIDDDGLDGDPVKIAVSVDIQENGITVDFSGSSAQVRGAINAPLSITQSASAFVVKAVLGTEIPNNAGFQRVLKVIAPEGTITNMSFPSACAARAVTAYRVTDAVLGAFAQGLPDRVPAAGDGGPAVISVGGEDENGQPFVFMEIVSGASGGRPNADGLEGVAAPIANTQNTSCELIEATFPLRVEHYGFVPCTGGAGTWRGGLSVRRDVRFLGRTATLQIRSDRSRTRPWGLSGGLPGANSENRLYTTSQEWRRLPSKVVLEIKSGEMWRHTTAGGGGWGDPSQRDVASLDRDENDEKAEKKAPAETSANTSGKIEREDAQ
jgi:N-methylhydantoinase B/oxoprolinase/acetone carboxylase alpha subunit/N-methylhydantoinase A/oxoprolinase/acetone carboxylase beta subunit